MFCFERNNKRVKALVKHTTAPLASVANHVELDIQARLELTSKKTSSDFEQPPAESLSLKISLYRLSQREKDAMQVMGITSPSFRDFKAFEIAKIFGVHFRSGQWACHRCNSVTTTIYRDTSRCCIVNAFLLMQGKSHASVTWLSPPTYPRLPFKKQNSSQG